MGTRRRWIWLRRDLPIPTGRTRPPPQCRRREGSSPSCAAPPSQAPRSRRSHSRRAALASRISSATCRIEVVNLHNFGLIVSGIARITTHIRATPATAGMYSLFFGDWNLAPPNTPTLVSDGGTTSASNASNAERGKWRHLLSVLTLVPPRASTRFAWRVTRRGSCELLQSCLDYPALSFPPPLMARYETGITAAPPPASLLAGEEALSDHVLVTFRLRIRPPGPPPSRPAPAWVVRHPVYAVLARELLDRLPSALHPNDLHRRTKQTFRVASVRARDRCLDAHPRSHTARAQLALQAIRATHSADLPTLRRCLRRWPALLFLAAVTPDAIRFPDPAAFWSRPLSRLPLIQGTSAATRRPLRLAARQPRTPFAALALGCVSGCPLLGSHGSAGRGTARRRRRARRALACGASAGPLGVSLYP